LRATSSARFARQRFHRVLSAMAPGSSPAGGLASGRATPGPARPCPAATRYDPEHPLKRTGLPLGEPTWCKGRRPRPHERSSTQQGSGVPGPPSAPGNMPTGSGRQVTCAPVVMAHCSIRLVLPKPEEATTITSGSPADSSLRGREARCIRAVGQGPAISWRWDRHALFGPMRLPAGRPGMPHSREQAPPSSPCRG
jgi:hypothetical protein